MVSKARSEARLYGALVGRLHAAQGRHGGALSVCVEMRPKKLKRRQGKRLIYWSMRRIMSFGV